MVSDRRALEDMLIITCSRTLDQLTGHVSWPTVDDAERGRLKKGSEGQKSDAESISIGSDGKVYSGMTRDGWHGFRRWQAVGILVCVF